MPLPAQIPVKYSEDDAQFISIRPLVRQTFRPAELIDMIVSVTGKDPHRVQQILRSGTIVFNSYRYWWDAIDAAPAELTTLLSAYPDADPSRPFRQENCTEVILESAGTPPRQTLRLHRTDASRKRLFRTRSLWDVLLDLTRTPPSTANIPTPITLTSTPCHSTPRQSPSSSIPRISPRGLSLLSSQSFHTRP